MPGDYRVPESSEVVKGFLGQTEETKNAILAWVVKQEPLSDLERELVINFTDLRNKGMVESPQECRVVQLRQARQSRDLQRRIVTLVTNNPSLTM